jgi:hypothetical protein
LERKSFFQKWFKSDSGDVNSASASGLNAGRSSSGSASPPYSRKSSLGGSSGAAADVMAIRKPMLVNKDIPPELQGVSVKELVKVIGASRANGNGVTPPSTPGTPRKSRSISPAGPVSQLAFSRSRWGFYTHSMLWCRFAACLHYGSGCGSESPYFLQCSDLNIKMTKKVFSVIFIFNASVSFLSVS